MVSAQLFAEMLKVGRERERERSGREQRRQSTVDFCLYRAELVYKGMKDTHMPILSPLPDYKLQILHADI